MATQPEGEKDKGGRPIKLDTEIAGTILAYLRAGAYVETAAIAAGISKVSFYAWLKRGREAKDRIEKNQESQADDARFLWFLNAVEKVQAEADMIDLSRLDKFGGWLMPPEEAIKLGAKPLPPSWQAIAWKLERRRPKHFGRRNPDKVAEEEDPTDPVPLAEKEPGIVVMVADGEKLAEGEIDPAKAKWYDPPQVKRDG